jgi:protease I
MIAAVGLASRPAAWHDERADSIPVDIELKDAPAGEFNALLLVAFIAPDKPIAAICHGPWTLINAGA